MANHHHWSPLDIRIYLKTTNIHILSNGVRGSNQHIILLWRCSIQSSSCSSEVQQTPHNSPWMVRRGKSVESVLDIVKCKRNKTHCKYIMATLLGLYSLSRQMSYHNISQSLKAVRFRFRLFQSQILQAPWQQYCQEACQVSEWCDHHNTKSCSFETSYDLTVWCLTT